MKYVIGLDLGTTCVKALLFDENGNILAQASRDDALIIPQKGWAEQDANAWLHLASQAVRETVERANIVPSDVAALSISSQGITIVPVDEAFRPLANAINWLDTRTQEQVLQIERFGADRLYAITGKNISAGGYTLSKLLWLKEHRPRIYERAAYFLLPHDFVVAHLCGAAVTDHSMASATMLYDVPSQCWSEEILQTFSIDPSRLPRLAWAAAPAGMVREQIAAQWGLSPSAAVIVGGQDQKVAAYGAKLSERISSISMGTCEAYEFLFSTPPSHPGKVLPAFSYLEKGKWTLEGCTNTAGAAIKWARDQLFHGLSYDDMNALAAQAAPGARGVMFHPYLSGSGTPHYCEGNGAFSGLTLDVTRHDLVRAIFEGIAYEARMNLEAAAQAGVHTEALALFGGGSQSAPLCQAIADITGRSITSFACPEMGAMGAAKLAAKALGLVNFEQGSSRDSLIWTPDSTRHKAYNDLYSLYLQRQKGIATL
ncbi:hypothetical protein LJC27_06280 [Christensenellaceae bacterium OttesenSCG-928-M15]|nr:hypothetical protein [Christensenellaceae bacterium OttesenSCG-928-M15]